MVFIISSTPEAKVRSLAAFDSWFCPSILVLENMIDRITCKIPRARKHVNVRVLKIRVFWISSKVLSPQKSAPLSCEVSPKIAVAKNTILTDRYSTDIRLSFFVSWFFS